jgi:hypothetical protein
MYVIRQYQAQACILLMSPNHSYWTLATSPYLSVLMMQPQEDTWFL